MSTRRRHGANFTDSLISFRQTLHSDADSTCSTYKSFSQDSLDFTSNNNRYTGVESIIVAGNIISQTEDVNVLRNATDICQNMDKESCQMLESIVQLSTSVNMPVKEDSNMLNTALCISIDQNLESAETPQFMDKENLDNNQVKDPGKLNASIDTLSILKTKPARNTLSQMHIQRRIHDTEHENDMPVAEKDYDVNNSHTKILSDIEQPLGCTNTGSIETCNNIYSGKSIGSDGIQYHSPISGEAGSSISNKANEDINETQHCSFADILSHFIKDLHSTQSLECPKQILKRLSANFSASPTNFTERLITIIEESVTHNDSTSGNSSAVNLSRLTKEFKSMCKFLENESVPEWPPSPIASCSSNFGSEANLNDVSLSNKGKYQETVELAKTPSASTYHTPECSTPTKSFKTPLNILKSGNDSAGCILFNAQNDTFETLEAQCKIMCSDEDQKAQPITSALSQPMSTNNSPSTNMNKFLLLCEQQMASLDMSDCDKLRTQSPIGIQSPDSTSHCSSPKKQLSLQKQLRKKQFEKWNSDNQNKFMSIPMGISENPVSPDNATSNTSPLLSHKNDHIDSICKKSPSLHELEESVQLGIAEKRRRCFDTAMAMMRLNSNGETVQRQQGMEMLSEINTYCKSNNLESSSKELFNTLISCKNYYNYLEKHKTFINQVRTKEHSFITSNSDKSHPETSKSMSVNCDRENVDIFLDNEDNQIQVPVPKLSSTPRSSELKQNFQKSQKKTSRPRIFTTPGKSPVNRYHKRKPILFPNLCKVSAFKKTPTNLKSPVTEKLHKFRNNAVTSPVRIYIRGPDNHPISNVANKTHNLPHTPRRDIDVSPQTKSKQQSQTLRNIGETASSVTLSPRTPIRSQHINCKSYNGSMDVQNLDKTSANSSLQCTPCSDQKRTNRRKLFTTPGKTPVSKYQKRKSPLFTSVSKNWLSGMSPSNNLNCADIKGHHRFNNATVISPVGMYIKGTDIQFIQNVQSKTNDMLLTPEQTKSLLSQERSCQQCQSKKFENAEETSLKFRLSPRSDIKSPQHGNYRNYNMNMPRCNDKENSDNRLPLPKVVYTLPSQIRMEKGQCVGKNLVRGLLATTQSKVVIRHEGRVGSAARKKNTEAESGAEEISYASTDESIQVEKIATKTNFISKRKL